VVYRLRDAGSANVARMENVDCSKCGAGTEEGFLADNNLSNVLPSIWVAGAPESSFWTGSAGAKVSGKMKRRV